jgi:phenylacetate-CoA ligase
VPTTTGNSSVRNIIHRTYKLCNGGHGRYRAVQQEQWFDSSRQRQIQNERLGDIVSYAYRFVPYYRPLLERTGIVRKSGRLRLDRYIDLPLLNKEKIRENFDALKSKEIKRRKWIYKTTGGSTGEPLRVVHDHERIRWVEAVKDLCNDWVGVRFGDRKIRLWGSERDLFYGKEPFKVRLNRFINNAVWLNAFRMTPEDMLQYADKINAFKPILIKGYANCIYEFCLFIREKGTLLHSPHCVVTGAGNLTTDMRKLIEESFQAPVFDSYGSREIQAMAFECPSHEGLHVLASHLYAEVLNADGSQAETGSVGEIVLTPYFNYAMPLLRYRIGDMGTFAGQDCPCGRKWPLLSSVAGRVTECFYRKDGAVVPPEYFIHLVGVVLNDGWIKKFQVIQEEYDKIVVKIVCSETVGTPQETYALQVTELADKIRIVMNDSACRVEINFDQHDISTTHSGKYLYTISHVQRPDAHKRFAGRDE